MFLSLEMTHWNRLCHISNERKHFLSNFYFLNYLWAESIPWELWSNWFATCSKLLFCTLYFCTLYFCTLFLHTVFLHTVLCVTRSPYTMIQCSVYHVSSLIIWFVIIWWWDNVIWDRLWLDFMQIWFTGFTDRLSVWKLLRGWGGDEGRLSKGREGPWPCKCPGNSVRKLLFRDLLDENENEDRDMKVLVETERWRRWSQDYDGDWMGGDGNRSWSWSWR